MREVDEPLVARVGVDRCHQPVPDADPLVQHLRHRRQAVRGAGRVRHDRVPVRVVDVVEVDPEHDGDVDALARRRHDHLGRSRVQVLGGVRAGAETARGLEHQRVHAELAPGQVGRIGFAEDGDAPAVDDDRRLVGLDAPREGAVDAVVLEQMRERRGVGEVVERDPFDVGPAVVGRAERCAAHAAEAVDGDSNGHCSSSVEIYDPMARASLPLGTSGIPAQNHYS